MRVCTELLSKYKLKNFPQVAICLTDTKEGDGGFVVVRGSHKSNFACPTAMRGYQMYQVCISLSWNCCVQAFFDINLGLKSRLLFAHDPRSIATSQRSQLETRSSSRVPKILWLSRLSSQLPSILCTSARRATIHESQSDLTSELPSLQSYISN